MRYSIGPRSLSGITNTIKSSKYIKLGQGSTHPEALCLGKHPQQYLKTGPAANSRFPQKAAASPPAPGGCSLPFWAGARGSISWPQGAAAAGSPAAAVPPRPLPAAPSGCSCGPRPGGWGEAASELGRGGRSSGRRPAAPSGKGRGEVTAQRRDPARGGEGSAAVTRTHRVGEAGGHGPPPQLPPQPVALEVGLGEVPRAEDGPGARPPGLAAPRVHAVHGADPLTALGGVHREPAIDGERKGDAGGRAGGVCPPRPGGVRGAAAGAAALTGGRRCRAPGSARCRGRYNLAPSNSASWLPSSHRRGPPLRPAPARNAPAHWLPPSALPASSFPLAREARPPSLPVGSCFSIGRGGRCWSSCGSAAVPPRCDVSREADGGNGKRTKPTGSGGGRSSQ